MSQLSDVVPATLVDLAVAQVDADLHTIRPRVRVELELEFPLALGVEGLAVANGQSRGRLVARIRRLALPTR